MANEKKTLEQLKAEADLANQAYNLALKAEEQKKKEEAEKKMAKLAAVKEKRYAEIEDARKIYYKLVKDYIKDYGEYFANSTIEEEDMIIPFLFGSKPWRLFV